MQGSVVYNLFFATIISLVCAVLVASAAVLLRDRQEVNAALDMQVNVLVAAGLAGPGEALSREEVTARSKVVEPVVIDLETGEELPDVDPSAFNQRVEQSTPAASRVAPPNAAGVPRLPNRALVYKVRDEQGRLDALVLPIQGMGLWSTLYGFIALEGDLETVRGITYYEHRETPGLGGEVDNPRWRALWRGRKAFGEGFEPRIEVIKGHAGPPAEDPYRVDGLAGATMTSRGVTNMLHLWLGELGFGPYLQQLAERRDD